MPRFKIYAGLGGGFGGARFQCIEECVDKAAAEWYARELAREEYDSYGGYHGLYTWDSMRQEIADEEYDGDIEQVNPEDVDDRLMEEIEDWIVYKVIQVDDDYPLDADEDDDFNGDYDDDTDCFCD